MWWEDRDKAMPAAEVAEAYRDFIVRANVREAVVGDQAPEIAAALARLPGFSILGEDCEYARPWPSAAGKPDMAGVRVVGEPEAQTVTKVIRAAFPPAEGGFYSLDRVRKDMLSAGRYDVLLSEGGADIGFGSAIHDGGTGILNFVAVVRSAQGRGLGKRIMGILLAELDRVTHSRISLLVDGGNERAIGLYRRFGFTMSAGPFVHVKYDRS